MIIREIKQEDNLKIKQIIQDSLQSLGLAIEGTAYYDPQLGSLFEFYTDQKDAQYWVVELDNKLVGGVGIAPFNQDNSICELQKLYLTPETQGLGISNQLMERALGFASAHYKECYLETTHDLISACRLYEKFGFKLLEQPLEGSEHSAMNAWYLKKL